MPGPVPRGETDVCITVVRTPYQIQSLRVSLDVRATLVDVGANIRGLRLSAIPHFELVVGDWLCG